MAAREGTDEPLNQLKRSMICLLACAAWACASGEVDAQDPQGDASALRDTSTDTQAPDLDTQTSDAPDGDPDDAEDAPDTGGARILYVSAESLAGNGTRARPFGSVAAALRAVEGDEEVVLRLIEGNYPEFVTLGAGPITLEGGWPASGPRDVAAHPSVIAPEGRDADEPAHARVIKVTTAAPVVLDGLTVRAPDRALAGASTYAVWATGARLTMRDMRLEGGRAGVGAGGDDGRAGEFNNCQRYEGGAGGPATTVNQGCVSNRAADGGIGSPPADGGGRGGAGAAHACVQAGECGRDSTTDGDAGNPGAVGQRGADGRVPTDGAGSFVDGLWLARAASAPTEGERGGGGGGGGAGGDCRSEDIACAQNCAVSGGQGGRGGQGGCPGSPGENGEAGGASVLVLAADSALVVDGLVAVGGRGGDGGAGGQGGAGEAGRAGESGFTSFVGDGGDGGPGGRAGAGGHGVGGCAGPGLGIVLTEGATLQGEPSIRFEQTPSAGDPGAGAQSAADGCGAAAVEVFTE